MATKFNYNCLNREHYQNNDLETLETTQSCILQIKENLSQKGVTIEDWINTYIGEYSLWVLQLNIENGYTFDHNDFDEDWACEISFVEPRPGKMTITMLCA